MKVIRVATLLSLCLLLTELAPVSAATTAIQREQLQAARDEIAELNAQSPPDTVFQFNTGLDKPKELAGALSQILTPQARDLVDVDLGSFHDAQLENAEKRLNRQFEEKGNIRREQVQKLDQKHKRYQKLEVEIAVNQANAQQRLDAALEKKTRQQGHASANLEADIRTQTRRIESGKARQQQVSTRKAELAKSRSTTGYLKMRQEIAATRSKIAALQTAMQRKARFDRGSALLGVVLTAVSSEMEENALARQEGRPPLAANKVINFAKNISGYSTVKGVMDNVEMAKMEAMVSTLEFFEASGFDLNDPETQKLAVQRAEDAARRAVARTALYEGAKLAPVVGDLVSIKEGFDAAGDAYVAVEEAAYISAGNAEAQFQTSLRGAVKVEAKVRQMEAIAAQSKLLIASLDRLKGQLLVMEQGAQANRDKVRQAVNLLETYHEQAEALSSPSVAAALKPASIETLLGRLNAVKAAADEQSGNMQRVKAEHQSGQLAAQGVATQASFIGDLLQPAIADHTALQPALSRIENLGRSNELAPQVPATLEFLRQAKAVMQQQGERSNQLYEIYREQAGTLERLARQFQELRSEMPKYLAYVQSSKNLEDPHQDKIRAALDRANNVDIDQTALRRVIDDARGLHNSTGLAGALADLDKSLRIIDTSTVNALVQQAQQAWARLAGPNQAAVENLQKAQGLLHELVALAGDAKPIEIQAEPEISEDIITKKTVTSQKNQEQRLAPAAPPPTPRPVKTNGKTQQPAEPRWVKSFKGGFPDGKISFPYAWGAYPTKGFEQLKKTHTVDLPGPGYAVIWVKTSKTVRRSKNFFEPDMLTYNRTELFITDCSSMGPPPWKGNETEILKTGKATFYFIPNIESLGSSGDMINYKMEPGSYEVLIKWFAEKPPSSEKVWDGR